MTFPQKAQFEPLRSLFAFRTKIPRHSRGLAQDFRRKVAIYFERSKYRVRTIETQEELERVLQFRYEVFHREFQNKMIPFGIDWEALDAKADHLVIEDLQTDQIVGTYRLISTSFGNTLYSNTEFDLDEFLKTPGVKLELSRACIHRNYRNGSVITLLWRGVCEYIAALKADEVIGCSSVNTMDGREVARMISSLAKQRSQLESFTILPRESYLRRNGLHLVNQSKVEAIPSLLQVYLKAGAKVSLHPAWDYDFHCVDFFTVLKVEHMKSNFKSKYRIE
ncbi:GNAT family N-acetyltransferase [bacterium]|nr:GNAT family N-acetyltransferase [bacterium]NBX83700.1 GNAT family N-acetyltransferase [bacterium]